MGRLKFAYLVHSVCLFVCVQSVLSEGAEVAFQMDLTEKRQPAPSFVFIYMYVFYFESSKMWSAGGPKSVLVAIQILFFLVIVISFVDEFNRIQTKNRVKRNVMAIVVVCCLLSLLLVVVAVYFNERETFSTRDVAVLFVSYFAVLLLHTYRCFLLFSVCCCSVIILLSENSCYNFER